MFIPCPAYMQGKHSPVGSTLSEKGSMMKSDELTLISGLFVFAVLAIIKIYNTRF